MNQFDQLLTAIASEHLGIATLETRNADRLDFHDVSVWGVKNALRHAYQAGRDAVSDQAASRMMAALRAFIEADAKAEQCHEWKWENLEHAFALARDALSGAVAACPPSALPGSPPGCHPRFEVEHDPAENPDRVYVLVDGKFDVAIVRTDEGVVVDVYPKDGFETVATAHVFDADVEEDHQPAEKGCNL